MAGIDLGRILKNIFGKNLDEMSDAELVEKMKDISAPHEDIVSYDDLLSIPQDKWIDYDVKMVRIVPAEGMEPCELCAPLVGKYFSLIDSCFYLDHGRKNHRPPFCLDMVPAFSSRQGWKCDLPEYPPEGVPEALDYQVLHKWAEDVYNSDHVPTIDELTSGFGFEGFPLNREAYEAGEYAGFNPFGLYTCVCVTVGEAGEGEDLSWLIHVIDQAIITGLYGSRLSHAEKLRGELFLQTGNKEAALAAFRHAIELNPKIGLKRKIKALEKELGDV